MKLICFLAALCGLLSFVLTEDTMTEFQWGPACDGYDHCGTIQFCTDGSTPFGYREAGTSACLAPGPVIRLQKNTRYKITLENQASAATITNLHTHGLHISGDGNADDVTREVHGGKCLSYAWEIAGSQAEGTYWYHAHHHGNTNDHVSGGALGMMVVEDQPSTLLPSGITGGSDISSWLANEKLLMIAKLGNSWTGNGVSTAQLDLISGEWYRLRIGVSDPSAKANSLDITASSKQGANPCETRLVAHDGVFRSSVPSAATSSHTMTGASRVDLAVKCSGSPGDSAHISYANKHVATLTVVSGSTTTATPFDGSGNAWSPVRPYYLQDVTSATVDNQFSISMTAAQINGQSWDPLNALTTLDFDTVQEWTLSSVGAHPFHIHLYHMQVVTPGGCGGMHEYGEWYDTMGADCTVRFRTADVGQRCVLHCHVLSHEDNGAMGWVDVVNAPLQATTNPSVGEQDCSSSCVPEPGVCTPTYQCGSTEGTDTCGGACTATAGSCSSGYTCVNFDCVCSDQTCTYSGTAVCGDQTGSNTCGEACTVNVGSCASGETCVNGECVTSSCAQVGEPCSTDTDCCSSQCSNGSPSSRVCEA